jgi:hypothetical protein
MNYQKKTKSELIDELKMLQRNAHRVANEADARFDTLFSHIPTPVFICGTDGRLIDCNAAMATKALFYPINPGKEEASWERFCTEAFEKFLNGTFDDEYQKMVVDQFDASLPEHPPWV